MPASTDGEVGAPSPAERLAGSPNTQTKDKAKLMSLLSYSEGVVGKLARAKDYVAIIGLFSTVQWVFARHAGLLVKTRSVETRWKGSPHPIWLRSGTSDMNTFLQVLVDEEYDFPVNRPAAIIDAGANIGLASIWFASKYPDARIIAVEPEKSNFDVLTRNVAPLPNVTPVHAALWSHPGTLAVDDPNDEGAWAFQTREFADSPSPVQTVPCLTVTELISEYDLKWIDLFKIDIEGAEKEVFDSPDEWIGSVGAIAIELHDRFKAGCSRSFYAAITAFPVERRRGENVFVARSIPDASAVTGNVGGARPPL